MLENEQVKMGAHSQPKTTAVIVNYFSASFALEAARSVLNSSSLGEVRIVVVDNSCDLQEESQLMTGLPREAWLVVNSINVGYGQACNQVLQDSDSDFFLILNPDAMLMQGALARLQQILLSDYKIGAVSPQAFWDEDKKYFLPPAHAPVLFFVQPDLIRSGSNSIAYRLISWLWRCYSLRVWTADRPLAVNNLCGGHVLVRRQAAIDAGGLFDPSFFVYFEDTDLFLRIQRSGYKLVIDPRAKAVHHYDQCDPENRVQKRVLMEQAYSQFVHKHRSAWYALNTKLCAGLGRISKIPQAEQVLYVDHPEQIQVPEFLQGNRWLLEWSPNKDFIPAVGYFSSGERLNFSDDCIKKLASGKYFFRFGRPRRYGRKSRIYCWEKDDQV